MQHKKTVKSFKQLSKLKKNQIFDKQGKFITKPKTDKKFLISVARQLSEGFDKDLRKTNYNDYKRAKKVVKAYFQAVNNEKIKVVRPTKKNRAKYAKFSGMNKKNKVYLMPVISDKDNFKISKGKLKRISEYNDSKIYFFNKKKLALDSDSECDRLWNIIKKEYKKKKFAVRIKFVQGELSGNLFSVEAVKKFINRLQNSYNQSEKFIVGLIVYTFKNQEKTSIDIVKLKKPKKTKKK